MSERTHETTAPVEPLAESAPLTWKEAPHRCFRDPGGDSCLSYHRVWQYLRLLGIISSVCTNTEFLIDAFRRVARTGRTRILIAATADYSMLAHVAHAYAQESITPDVTVADRCGTSLWLNAWYAQRFGVALTTECTDVLEYRPDVQFDVITTHNFLGRFEESVRARLIAGWASLLRPGGVVITTQRIRPGTTGVRSGYSEHDARELAAQVERAAGEFTGELGVAPAELAREVHQYALRKRGYIIRSVEEVTRAFEAAGLKIELSDTGGGVLERRLDRPSSLAGPETFRMRLIARRR